MKKEQKITDWWLCECPTGCDSDVAQDVNVWSHDICITLTKKVRKKIIDFLVENNSLIINALDIYDINEAAFDSLYDNCIMYGIEIDGEYYCKYGHIHQCNINDTAIDNNYIMVTGEIAEEALSRMPDEISNTIRQSLELSTYMLSYEYPYDPEHVYRFFSNDDDNCNENYKRNRFELFIEEFVCHHIILSEIIVMTIITMMVVVFYSLIQGL